MVGQERENVVRQAIRSIKWVWNHSLGALLRWLLLGLIRGYQLLLSPLLGARCKYHPSCSHYGYGAVSVHGAVKGSVLTGWRLLRCNPWSLGGVDPVPPQGAWRPLVGPDGRPRPVTPATPQTVPAVHRSGDPT